MRSLAAACGFGVLSFLAACGADPTGAIAEVAPAPAPRPRAPAPVVDDGPGPLPDASMPGPATQACIAQPSCDGTSAPALGPLRPFSHTLSSVVTSGSAFHRGRDAIYTVGEPQWIIGKFTYSHVDKDLKDEDVDIFLERGCSGVWEKLATTKTTYEGAHPPVDGVNDSGGRVYFEIPTPKQLAPGRHRVRLVVAGDHTSTDLLIDIVPQKTQVAISDVDGTLTDYETAEWNALLDGALPGVQPGAADALRVLVGKGYRIVYLTARPEWLTNRTKEFLSANAFPTGIVRTTTSLIGAPSLSAVPFKTGALQALTARGLALEWAFGNQPTDTYAYDEAKINPVDQRIFLGLNDSHGGRRIETYADILATLNALPATCK